MKKTFILNKLVRDHVCDKMISEIGAEIVSHKITNHKELMMWLKKKVCEEAHEVADAESGEHVLEELSDLLEVIHAFGYLLGISFDNIDKKRKEKSSSKGGFTKAIVIESVTLDSASEMARYFAGNPEKYKSIYLKQETAE